MSQQPTSAVLPAPKIVFILGAPASGKGTLCKLVAGDNLYHLSVGDYLRYLIDGTLSDKPDVVDAVKSGGTRGLVPGEVIVPLLMQKIKDEICNGKDCILLDGFPRDADQNKVFREAMMSNFAVETPDVVLLINCPKRTAKERYLSRRRGDDDEQMFEKRYAAYEERDIEVVRLFENKLIKVDSDATPEESAHRLREVLADKGLLKLSQNR